MYLIKTFFQFLIFFALFLATHYWMSREDVFYKITFNDVLPLFLISSTYIGILVVLLIQVISFTNQFLPRLLAYLFGLMQIYLNFTYFEYYIVFKIPLFGKDIIYMGSPSSIWQLAEGSVWNIRFPFFVILPAVVLALSLFSSSFTWHRRLIFEEPRKLIKLGVLILGLLVGLSLFEYYPTIEKRIGETGKTTDFGYKRNTLISTYEAFVNYLQFHKEYPKPENITDIRKTFVDNEKRKFTDPDYPLLHQKEYKISPNHRNIIVIMLESFSLAEVYALSGNPTYEGATLFLDELIPQTLSFPNTFGTGIHTFYGVSELLSGNASDQYQSWNRRINISLIHSLPQLLQRNGYRELAWYYGGKNKHFDMMYGFSGSLGFNRKIFYESFSNDSKNSNWGKSDRETLMMAARDILGFQGPFLSFVLSLTKHGPWNIPPDFDYQGFERDFLSKHKGKVDDGLRNSIRLIYYYDQILKEFFSLLEGHPNFENSLVIITSDQAFFPDIKGSNAYHNMKNGFNIPLIFYEPGEKTLKLGKNEVFASHLDIIPTLIHYLGLEIPKEVPYQGKNLLDPIHQQDIDAHSHVSFWQDDFIYFTQDGFYKLSTDPEHNDIILVDPRGEERAPLNSQVNEVMINFKKIYPYLINNNKVFPTTE